MEGLKIPIGAPIQALTKDLNAAKAQVKSFVGYTDAQLLKSSQSQYGSARKVIQVNEQLAESAALAAKAQRTQAAATAASGGALANLGTGLQKSFSMLTKIAYIVPGLGIAGIFTLAFDALSPLIAGLEIFNKKVEDGSSKYNSLRDAIASGNQEAAKEVTTLRLLYEASTNLQNPQETRIKAAKELIRLFPETFKDGSEEAIMNGTLGKSYQDLTKDIIANARAKAIAGKIADEEAKILDAQIKRQKTVNANLNENAKIKDVRVDIGMGQSYIYSQEQQIAANNKRTKEELANIDKIITKAEQTQKFLQQFVGDKNLVNALVGDDKARKAAKETITAIERDFIEAFKIIGVAQGKQSPSGSADVNGGNIFIKPVLDTEATYTTGQILKDYFQVNLLPQISTSFKTFFDDLLMHGELSFKTLGQSIKNTFASVLADESTKGIISLLTKKGEDKGGSSSGLSLLPLLLGLGKGAGAGAGAGAAGLAATGTAAAGTAAVGVGAAGTAAAGGALVAGTVASGGLLLPILAAVGATLAISNMFKKKKVPMPAPASSVSTSAINTGAVDISGGRVVFEISGVNLVGVLNRAGAKLARYGTI
jgi:hypothetical protein